MEKRDFTLAKLALWGLVLCTGALAVFGVLSLFGDVFPAVTPWLMSACILAFAGMAFSALCVSQAAAACAQVLDGAKFRHARTVAWGCAVVTGLVSVAGVYLGDAVLRGHPPSMPPIWAMVTGGFVLCFIKPAMSFVITACESKECGRLDATAALIAVKDARIAELEQALRQAQKPNQAKAETPAPVRGRASAHQARTLARELSSQAPVGPSARHEPMAIERPAPEPRDVSLDEIEAACRAIIERRDEEDQPLVPSLRLVAIQLNVPKSRIDKALLQANTKLAVVTERVRLAA